MTSVNELNWARVERAIQRFHSGKEIRDRRTISADELVDELLQTAITGLPGSERGYVSATSLVWFALDTLYISDSGNHPTVSLRLDNISPYLVFGRVFKRKHVLENLTWSFAHYMAYVMSTKIKMVEISVLAEIESFTPTMPKASMEAWLPYASRKAGAKINQILSRIDADFQLV
jgi:hypothetical protein